MVDPVDHPETRGQDIFRPQRAGRTRDAVTSLATGNYLRFDLDPACPDAIGLGEEDPEDAVGQFRGDPVAVDLVAEDERPLIIPEAILLVQETSAFGSARIDPGIEAQDVVFQVDPQVLLDGPREIGLEDKPFRSFMDVDRGREGLDRLLAVVAQGRMRYPARGVSIPRSLESSDSPRS